jgi:PEP-CTERM motif
MHVAKTLTIGLVALAALILVPSGVLYAGSCADNTSCDIELTNSNTSDLDNNIDIRVTIDNTNADNLTRLIVSFISDNVTNTPLGIDQFGYTGTATVSSCPSGWTCNLGLPNNIDGFGSFPGNEQKPGSTDLLNITFVLNTLVTNFPDNTSGAEFAVHIRYDGCSGFVSDGTAAIGSAGDCTGTPVPEPATLFLVGSGLVSMGYAGRKRWLNRGKN